MQHSKKLFRLLPSECIFLECDIQEKFRKLIQHGDTVIHNARRLGQVAKVM